MSKVAIIQSNYIPWKGYFHIIQSVDHFVFLDSVKYTRCDWRNRNRIKTPEGTIWLSVPVHGHHHKPIYEAIPADKRWQRNHPLTLRQYYAKCLYFENYYPLLEKLYKRDWEKLSDINQVFTWEIAQMLGIKTQFHQDRKFITSLDKSRRLLDIVMKLGADTYVTGPSASAYLDEGIYQKEGVKVEYFKYPKYPEYEQFWGEYVSDVSVLDLLFHQGNNSGKYIWGK